MPSTYDSNTTLVVRNGEPTNVAMTEVQTQGPAGDASTVTSVGSATFIQWNYYFVS